MKKWEKIFKRTLWIKLRRRFYIGGPLALAVALAAQSKRKTKSRRRKLYNTAKEREKSRKWRAKQGPWLSEYNRERAKKYRAKKGKELREFNQKRAFASRAAATRFAQACAQISVLKQVGQLSQNNTP